MSHINDGSYMFEEMIQALDLVGISRLTPAIKLFESCTKLFTHWLKAEICEVLKLD